MSNDPIKKPTSEPAKPPKQDPGVEAQSIEDMKAEFRLLGKWVTIIDPAIDPAKVQG